MSAAGELARPARDTRPLAVIWRRTIRNPMTRLGIWIVTSFVVLALLPIGSRVTDQNLANALALPSWQHLLGTDEFGRDLLARVAYGARLSMFMGLSAVLLGAVVGCTLGVVAGYFRGWSETLIMRCIDILLAVPGMLLAIALVATLGSGPGNVILAVGVNNIPQFARLSRSTVLAVCKHDFIAAARALGATHGRILFRHVLPNALGPVVVFATLRFSNTILVAAGLGFLGLGVQPPTPEWGAMLATSRKYLFVAPHLAAAYGASLTVLVLGINALGEGLRDVLDPRSR